MTPTQEAALVAAQAQRGRLPYDAKADAWRGPLGEVFSRRTVEALEDKRLLRPGAGRMLCDRILTVAGYRTCEALRERGLPTAV